MPRRNIEKIYLPDAYYHIYNRGVNKNDIFLDDQDFSVFINLLKRYLNDSPEKDLKGREYDWLYPEVELLAFCLMSNHFHLFIYQTTEGAITKLIRAVAASYSVYFNKKYQRRGPLFESRYLATNINSDAYLAHISRYIHLNPPNYKNYEWSSLPYYLDKKHAPWIRPDRITDLFSKNEYEEFVNDHLDHKKTMDALKIDLAG